MKFLFLSSYAHYALDAASERVSGGAELQVALLAKELAKRGHDAVVVVGDTGQLDHQEFEGVRTRVGGNFQTGGLMDASLALPRILKILREERPDFCIVVGWTAWLFILQMFRGWGNYQLVFVCSSDVEVNGAFRRENPCRGWLFEHAVRRANARYAMSLYQKRQFELSGLSCGLYRNLILPKRDVREMNKDIDFLWVSRCRSLKRPLKFLDLAAHLPAARFTMICPNEDNSLWTEVSRRAAALPNVIFHEQVPYHQIQGFYDRTAVFVNTSEYEGFPNSFIQAGQGGAAILSYQVDPDFMLSKYEAGVCADGDEAVFIEMAKELMKQSAMLAKLQSQASFFVAEFHDNDRNVDAFLAGLPAR